MQPDQPLVFDEHGVLRFKSNSIVNALLKAAQDGRKMDLNTIATMDFPLEDRIQFAQLTGYSACGLCDLSYAQNEHGELNEHGVRISKLADNMRNSTQLNEIGKRLLKHMEK